MPRMSSPQESPNLRRRFQSTREALSSLTAGSRSVFLKATDGHAPRLLFQLAEVVSLRSVCMS